MRATSLALAIVTAAGLGCAATPPEGLRLLAAIEAERAERFAGPPEQTARGVQIHTEFPGGLPPGFASEAAGLRARFAALLGRPDAGPALTILVFDSPARLQAALQVSPGVHGLAVTSADPPVVVLAAGEGDAALRRHLKHELTHVASDLSADPSVPAERAAWVEEGLAYLLEWSDDDGVPRPALGLLQILHDQPPRAGEVPAQMSAHYRPRGDAATMRRLAAAAATLIHFYWDRAARAGAADLRALLRECAQRDGAALARDDAAWQRHWRRLLFLAQAKSYAGQSARYLGVASRRALAADDAATAERLTAVAEAAERLEAAARAASAPGGAWRPEAADAALAAAQGLARWLGDALRAAAPPPGADLARVALERLARARQAAGRGR